MERIAVNQEEQDWQEWLERAQDGVVTQRQAADAMEVSEQSAEAGRRTGGSTRTLVPYDLPRSL
jgi:hypothetical protein